MHPLSRHVSRHARAAEPSPLARARAERERSGAAVFDLTLSNPTEVGLAYDRDAIALSLASADVLRYRPEPGGSRAAREAVSREYAQHGVDVAPERIVLTASFAESYSHVLSLLCGPHDQVLVPAPGPGRFAQLAGMKNVHAAPYSLGYRQGRFELDPAAIYEAIGERTRLAIVGHPSPPTGAWLTRDAADALDACGVPILSDEAFARYPIDDDRDRAPSMLVHAREALVFALGGLSELAALPQMKLAWIALAGPDQQVASAIERLGEWTSAMDSVGTLVQDALPSLLSTAPAIRGPLLARCRRNHERLLAAARASRAEVARIGGGWQACVRLPGDRSDEAWALALLERRGVLVDPGSAFDLPEKQSWIVISLLAPEPTFDMGLDAMIECVAR